MVLSQAEFYYNGGEHIKAARLFARSGLSFDAVVLRLLNLDLDLGSRGNQMPASKTVGDDELLVESVRDKITVTGGVQLSPLRVFLLETLKVLPASSKSQRTMLCTWLCEIFLHQIEIADTLGFNHSASSSSGTQYSAVNTPKGKLTANAAYLRDDEARLWLTKEFKDFLRAHKASLDPATTFNLIISRNNRALLLFYAQIVGDYHRVVSVFMTERRHNEAIAVLTDAPLEKVTSLIYKTAPVLIEFEPEATIQMLVAKPQLATSSLIPALLRYTSALDKQKRAIKEAKTHGKGIFIVVMRSRVLLS